MAVQDAANVGRGDEVRQRVRGCRRELAAGLAELRRGKLGADERVERSLVGQGHDALRGIEHAVADDREARSA